MSNREQTEPTRGQLMTMAYVDGELAESSGRTFEDRLGRDWPLMREVTKQKRALALVDQIIASGAVALLQPTVMVTITGLPEVS